MILDNLKKGVFMSVGKTMADLPNQIRDGEQPKMVICGQIEHHSGVLILTDQRVFWYSKRLLSKDLTDMPIGRISSVNFEGGVLSKKIKISYSGGDFEMKAYDKEAAIEFARMVSETMNPQVSKTSTSPTDRVERLLQLYSLKEKGIISEEEFQNEKTKILEGDAV